MKIPVEEALRYMRVPKSDEATRRLAEETAAMLEKQLHPRFLWRAFPVRQDGEGILLEGAGLRLPGNLAAKMLSDCDTAVLLVCTLGALGALPPLFRFYRTGEGGWLFGGTRAFVEKNLIS